MRLSDDPTRYTSQWKYVETAKFVDTEKFTGVARDQVKDKDNPKIKHPILIDIKDIEAYQKKHKNTGIYTSVWRFNAKELKEDNVKLGSLYFDIDNEEDVQSSLDTARALYQYLSKEIPKESIRVYFTGLKGFHIECEALALGITPSNHLSGIFRFIANSMREELDIDTLDFQVYDERRMWRLPYSKHQKTGLYKNELPDEILSKSIEEIRQYCEEPKIIPVDVPEFSPRAGAWYKEFTYEYELSLKKVKEFSAEEMLERFNKYGTSIVHDGSFEDLDREFSPKDLFEGCPAILKHWETADKEHHLSHEARLFLCSILTYSDEALWYLHQILSLCYDYNPDISQAHINDWIKRRELGIGGRPYSCRRANDAGVGCGQCDLEPRNKWVQIGNKQVETGEQAQPSPIRFAYKYKKKE